MHEHKEPKACKHELKFCTHCDTVYCEKCKEEWKKQQFPNVYVGDILDKKEKWTPPWMNNNLVLCTHEKSNN